MTLKGLLKKIQINFSNDESKKHLGFVKRYWVSIIYLLVFVGIFLIYSTTYNYVNNQEEVNEKNLEIFLNSKESRDIKKNFFSNIQNPYSEYKYVIQNNDTIERILKKFKINKEEINLITKKLKQQKLTNIYSGRELNIVMKKIGEKNSIIKVSYPINNTLTIEIRKSQQAFLIKQNIIKLDRKEVVITSKINNNLYSAAVEAGIEPNVIIEFARIYGFEVDFQRDIRKGDTFEIYYEKFVDEKSIVRDTGKIIYAHMNVNNKEINLYNFKDKNEIGYYDINGKSIVKSLMKTPINGARLSSSFGMRKHPILGFNKMHKGTDFAAPTGTPIMASGSGTVTRARWCGGGGNCVKIRHNSTYETIYAHMSKFASGIKEGRKVKQGQIIGYVGSTGLSTGPHLHYEVVVNGKKVNSQKLKLPSGKILRGKAREEFELSRIKIDLKLSELKAKN